MEIEGEIVEIGNGVKRLRKGDKVVEILDGGGYEEYEVVNERNEMKMKQGFGYIEEEEIKEKLLKVWNNVLERGWIKEGEVFMVNGGQ